MSFGTPILVLGDPGQRLGLDQRLHYLAQMIGGFLLLDRVFPWDWFGRVAGPAILIAIGVVAVFQEMVEEYWRLDRHNPWWMTGQINTSAVLPNRRGTVPALRTEAHLLADVFPGLGFGRRRFPDRDGDDAFLRPQPASTPWTFPQNTRRWQAA